MGCCNRKSLIERDGCLGIPESMAAWDMRGEREDAKNKLSALLFCLGLVQMLGMSSWVKQNPCLLSSRRGDLG